MDKLDLLSAPAGRLNVQASTEKYDKQARLDLQRREAAEAVTKENQRAASDTVEISAAALELLKTLNAGG